MKKAVISTGGKQYLVSEGDELEVELINSDSDKKSTQFDALLFYEGEKIKIGTPFVKETKVTAEVIGQTVQPKVTSIRYKAKKRVHKLKGHRQKQAKIKIKSIK